MVSESWQLDRKFKGEVLILVVVEDGLRDADAFFFNASSNRLILVVVEDGLRDTSVFLMTRRTCLNPCCGGRWSQRRHNRGRRVHRRICLNPCCGGRWSQRAKNAM